MSKSFEEKIEDLERIVTELENGDLSLDDSVSKFEQGIKISKECNKILEEAEKKITILVNQDGEIKEKDFQTEE
ncbi:MAG: exodeoxyribonuclease VII small subunit [Clostridia bacterium]